ncbi:TetR/AcrR family transcriptional regulator [Kineosporia sp. R_H_3]|uniref:TetR/AcrR family transcriptional regulator n=1 Tax=Kineosporia sp. R_H_3 TaxID=1961848 RepID=UPI0018E9B871|nr:TetR/AcrR family transcriptional regulator [Kineosporia sp. R_H_3]
MSGRTGGNRTGGKQTGVRNFLSRELILEAAFRVVDADDMNEITMSRLGRELDADPSAVYRHFRNKDELLLAMADVMLEESMNSYVEGDAPVENLRRMCWTLRRSYLRRPGLARAVASRFTGGAAEAASVAHMLANMAELGYDEDTAIANARALAEMTLGHIVMTADVLALPVKTQAFELEMGRSYYTRPRTPGAGVTPAEQRAAHLEDGEQIFGVMIDTFIEGLVVRAPRSR